MKWKQLIKDRQVVKQGYYCLDCGEYKPIQECNCKPTVKKTKKKMLKIDTKKKKDIKIVDDEIVFTEDDM